MLHNTGPESLTSMSCNKYLLQVVYIQVAWVLLEIPARFNKPCSGVHGQQQVFASQMDILSHTGSGVSDQCASSSRLIWGYFLDRDRGKRGQCAETVGRQGKETQQSRQQIQSKHIPVTSASGLRGEDSPRTLLPWVSKGTMLRNLASFPPLKLGSISTLHC